MEILRDRRIFVYFHLNKGGNGIRSPPNLKFELKIKFQIREDKTVKHAPKKVFILENGQYKEITLANFKNSSSRTRLMQKNSNDSAQLNRRRKQAENLKILTSSLRSSVEAEEIP